MVKIRLQGTKEELETAVHDIKQIFKVLECSAPYANRGDSSYFRVYMDVEVPTDSEVLFKALNVLGVLL